MRCEFVERRLTGTSHEHYVEHVFVRLIHGILANVLFDGFMMFCMVCIGCTCMGCMMVLCLKTMQNYSSTCRIHVYISPYQSLIAKERSLCFSAAAKCPSSVLDDEDSR